MNGARGDEGMFTGFPEETIRFFLGLRFHNDKTYYKAHEDEYREFVKKPFYELIEELTPAALEIDKSMEVRPSRCLARIYRDVRFTKDKSPFRDHLWLQFHRGGESRDGNIMYWFELGPERLNWGLGFWGENKEAMALFREMMAKNPKKVLALFKECGLPNDDGLVVSGESYKKLKQPDDLSPKLKELYMLKSPYFERINANMKDAYSGEIAKQVIGDMLRLKPMYQLFRGLSDEATARRGV